MSETIFVPPTVTDFRAAFAAFGDQQRYPTGAIQPWLNIATASLDPNRWQQLWQMGCMLYAAHFIALNKREERVAEFDGVPGNATPGVVSSKGIGAGSVGYDVGSSVQENSGQWALTLYGRQYLQFSRMAGMGGAQVNGAGPASPWLNANGLGGAWPGVEYP